MITATVDPVVVSGISNLNRYARGLEKEFGVRVRLSNSSGNLYIEGTLIQVQCVQQQLDSKYREHTQEQQQELTKLAQPDSMMPRHDVEDTGLPPVSQVDTGLSSRRDTYESSLHRTSSSPFDRPLSEEHLNGRLDVHRSMPTIYSQDQLSPMRHQHNIGSTRATEESMGLRDETREPRPSSMAAGTATKSSFQDNAEKVDELFNQGNPSYLQPSARDDPLCRYSERTTTTSSRYRGTEARFQSLPVGQPVGPIKPLPRNAWDVERNRPYSRSDPELQERIDNILSNSRGYSGEIEREHLSTRDDGLTDKGAGRPIEEEETGLIKNLDPHVLDYMWKIKEVELATLQSKYFVEFVVEDAGDFKQILIISTESNDLDSKKDVEKAQKEFLRLYHTMLAMVVKKVVNYDFDKIPEAELRKILQPVETAYGSTILFQAVQPGELAVIGFESDVCVAAGWALDKLKSYNHNRSFSSDTDPNRHGASPRYSETEVSRGAGGRERERQTSHFQQREEPKPVVRKDFRVEDGRQHMQTSEQLSSKKREFDESEYRARKSHEREGNNYGATGIGHAETEIATAGTSRSSQHLDPTLTKAGTSREHEKSYDENYGAYSFQIGTMHVDVYTGDLTRVKVDAIVNPANGDLSLIGGLSYDIKKAAPADLQEECTKFVSLHGPLKVSSVFTV